MNDEFVELLVASLVAKFPDEEIPIPSPHLLHQKYCTQIFCTTTMIFTNALLKFVPPPFVRLFDSSNLFVSRGTPSLALDYGDETPKKSNDHLSPSTTAIEEEPAPALGLVRWTDSNGNRRMRSTRVRKPPSRYGCL
jgi:hypothetical protein